MDCGFSCKRIFNQRSPHTRSSKFKYHRVAPRACTVNIIVIKISIFLVCLLNSSLKGVYQPFLHLAWVANFFLDTIFFIFFSRLHYRSGCVRGRKIKFEISCLNNIKVISSSTFFKTIPAGQSQLKNYGPPRNVFIALERFKGEEMLVQIKVWAAVVRWRKTMDMINYENAANGNVFFNLATNLKKNQNRP